MSTISTSDDPAFIINVGDSFYWCGIQNVSDYQVNTDWIEPFSHPSLSRLAWYSALGNHEYGYNVSAQLDLANKYKNWIMDDRYYTRRVLLSGSTYATFIVLDTSPCVSAYRSSSRSGWDPCGSDYPTCSLDSGNDDFEVSTILRNDDFFFESFRCMHPSLDFVRTPLAFNSQGPCEFHDNIMTQSCTTQYDWFKKTIAAVSSDDWLFIIGHHALDEVDEEDFVTPAQEHGFSMYYNGHTHTLNAYQVDDKNVYITSGAGSMVDTADQHSGSVLERLHSVAGNSRASKSVGHTYQTLFNQVVAGFAHSTFSSDFTTLETSLVNFEGKAVYSVTVNKAGEIQKS